MSEAFDKLVNIVVRLRSPNGCPWDRKQTLYSLKQNVIEEVYEFIDALDRKDIENIKEELGDMLLHIVFHSVIAQENEFFSIDDVINDISNKLIRRHPHVFGSTKVSSIDEVLENWDKIKISEKHDRPKHYLDGIPRGMPPIERAFKLQQKVRGVGFDWKNADECFEKVKEEFIELEGAKGSDNVEELEHEIGDLMFAVINFARLSNINPAEALRKATMRFENRFKCMENKLKDEGKTLQDVSLEEMDKLWQKCKEERS